MANYRVPEFTAEQRADVALRMLLPFPDRPWGLATELARLFGGLHQPDAHRRRSAGRDRERESLRASAHSG